MTKNLLKELSLQGYKTFASKTTFQFPGRVTAVVGPNGSGKSNIADSIRWVLGEQAYSLLRGKKTTDMIFFGSEQRSRASMASASITFENESGWLPIDYSEVTITRRAYRSGENEYLLNDQKVRLKDIDELLANSGLGERTYTIIGQGLVDNALSQRPEDRRSLFEEAAGIGLYKGRREESIGKLDKTIQNMVRINDILKEIKPNLSKLEKSLEKTRQFELAHSNLEEMLKIFYGHLLFQARLDLAETNDFYQSQKDILQNKKEERDKAELKVQEIQSSINSNREKLAISHQELAEKHKKEEELNRTIAILDERQKSLHDRQQDLSSSLAVQESRFERNKEISNEFEEKIAALELNAKKLNQNLDILKEKLEEERIKNQKLDLGLEKLYESKREIETNLLLITPKEKALESSIERNQNEIELVNQNIKQKNIEIKKAKERFDENKKKVNDVNALLEERKKELILQETSFEEHANMKSELEEKIAELKRDLSQIDARLDVIEEDEDQNRENNGLELVISKFGSTGKNEKLLPLIQLINVEPKYERAIATALGSKLSGVIIKDHLDINEVVNFIKKNRTQRTILIPDDWKDIPYEEVQLPQSAVLASTLITESEIATGIVGRLLKRIIVTKDFDEAIVLRRLLKPGWGIVTQDGDLIDSNGYIATGEEKQSSALLRKRTKQELNTEKSKTLGKIDEIENKIERLDKESKSLNEKIIAFRNEIFDHDKDSRELNLIVYKLKIELEQYEKDIRNSENTKASLLDQKSSIQMEFEQNKLTAEDLKQKLTEIIGEIKKIEPQIDRTRFNELQNETLDLSSQLAIHNQVQKQQSENYKSHLLQLNEIAVQRDEVQEKIEQVKNEIHQTREQLGKIEKESKSVREQIREKNIELRPLEEDVDQVLGKQGKILNELESKRRDYSVAERHTLQAQIKFEKSRDKLESIQAKIQDDIGFILPANDSRFSDAAPLPFDELLAKLPEVKDLPAGLEDEIRQQKALIRRIGPVNPDAKNEYSDAQDRINFLEKQMTDLNEAEKDLREIVEELDAIMKKEFLKTFNDVQEEFTLIFEQLFNGGKAELFIADIDDIFNSGIEIEATLPGKRKQELALLSGGEKSLAAVALIFALLRISPTPFCVLDEVDAMLDESNVARFGELLRELSEFTQFIVITHNRNTVQLADVLYGITIGKDSVSQVISLKFDQLTDEMVA